MSIKIEKLTDIENSTQPLVDIQDKINELIAVTHIVSTLLGDMLGDIREAQEDVEKRFDNYLKSRPKK